MSDLYGILHEGCTGRYGYFSVPIYVWRRYGTAFRSYRTANEDDQSRNRRQWVYSWRRDGPLSSWENICKQNPLCGISLQLHVWRRDRYKTGRRQKSWLRPYRWAYVRRDAVCKLCRKWRRQIRISCNESSSNRKSSGTWLWGRRRCKSCSGSMQSRQTDPEWCKCIQLWRDEQTCHRGRRCSRR